MGVMGFEVTKDGWTEIRNPEAPAYSDFRYRAVGYRVQAEINVNFRDRGVEWANFGVFKDRDDLYGEIELSRAEPEQ